MSEEQKKLEPNSEHLAKLKEGVEVWNEWIKKQRKINSTLRAQLEGSNLTGLKLKGVDLKDVDLRDVNLRGADLREADLRGAKLRDANLNYANLKGADLHDANLIRTKLVYAKNINFSDNRVADAVITSTTTSPWLTLKKSYTNTMMIFTLAAVFAFFLPYIVNIAVWRGVNLSQEITQNLEIEEIKNATECFSDNAVPCNEWKIWQLVLGRHREDGGVFFALLSVILIVYNLLRLYLTQQVSVLRDSEQAIGLTPRWETEFYKLNIFNRKIPIVPTSGYKHLFYIHRFVRVVFLIAIVSFAVHSYAWLNDVVKLPPPAIEQPATSD